MDLKEALKDELSEEELEHLVKSFEVIGDVAIIEVPEELEHRKELIGEKLMELNKHIRTVLREVSGRKGTFRTRDYELIAGEEDTETLHKEHGARFRLDPREVYFSEREGKERQRIVEQVGEGETVMAMFAGVGPYPIVIANQVDVEKIYAVELNPCAYKYLEENVSLNKLDDVVEPMEGDVRKLCPDYFGECDRVLMPLPKGSEDFLELAMKCLKDRGTVHYYSWSEEEDLYEEAEKELKEAAEELGKEVNIKDKRKVLPYAPGKWKICLDCIVENKRKGG
ncbi:MAG: class I SAM-dependent methyltransferase [Candidatus Aenigmatarchaeota archaeon]